jgi:hypothetical protein
MRVEMRAAMDAHRFGVPLSFRRSLIDWVESKAKLEMQGSH